MLFTTWGGTEYAWSSPVIVGLAVATVVLGIAFAMVERRVPEPAIPLRLFRIRTFVVSAAVSLLVGMAMFGAITYLPTFLQVANGASASDSGLLLAPLMGGMLAASITAGQIITRTGRYRMFPIVGMAIVTLGMYLLSTLDTASSRLESGAYMVVLGVGMGMVMQILILAVQNEAPVKDLGVATSTVTFFRAVGGSVGVALFGALFSSRLGDLLGGRAPEGLTPEAIGQLPEADRAQMAGAFAESITMVFRYAVPLLAVGFLLTWLLKNVPLRSTSGEAARSDASTAADGAASPSVPVERPAVRSAAASSRNGEALPLEAEIPVDTMVAASDPAVVMD